MTLISANAVCNSHNRNKSSFLSGHLRVLLSLLMAGAIGLSGCSENQRGLGAGISSGGPIGPRVPANSTTAVFASAVDPATNMLYVVDSGPPQTPSSGTFYAVDGASNSVAATLTGLAFPTGVDVDSGTGMVYIANGGSNTVSVVNGATNAIVATIAVGPSPTAIAVNRTTHMIYVDNAGDGTVSVINGATNTVAATVATGVTGIDLIAIDPSLNLIYAGSNQGYAFGIALVQGASNTKGTTVYIQNAPQALAIDPTSHILYAESNEKTVTQTTSSTQIDAIDETDGTYLTTIPLAGFVNSPGMAFNAATSLLYAGNNTTSKFDILKQYAVASTVPYSSSGATVNSISVNSSTNTIYAVYSQQNGQGVSVQSINGATNVTTSTLKLQ